MVAMATQQGQILTWREAKLKNQVVTPPPLEERLSKVNCPMKALELKRLGVRRR